MSSFSPDLLIIGAGPVGLTMAAAALRQGLTCRIVDKAAEPSDKSKALVLWSRSLELLDKLDSSGIPVSQTCIAAGVKIDGARIHADGKPVVHIEIAGVDSPFGFPLMIPQNVTERILTEDLAAQGVTVEREVELLTFEERDDAIHGTLRHAKGLNETFTVPWLIGCDGAHSTVRHTLGMPFTGAAEQNDWMLADIHLAGPLPTNEISIFWHELGILVFFPIGGDRFRMIADLGLAGAVAPPTPTLSQAQAMVDARGPAGLTLFDPIWLAGFRINERKVTDYRRSRAILAGDAAHIHSPAGGQGMNTGMQDAFNLAWKLGLIQRGQGRADALLDSYSKERSAVGDQVLHAAARLTTVATLRNPIAQLVRNHVAGIVTSFGFVQDKIRNALCELSINYRGGPLSREDGRRLAIHAGDRLPDAELSDPRTHASTTLFAELRGPRPTIVLLPATEDERAVSRLVQIAKRTRDLFGEAVDFLMILQFGDDPSAAIPQVEGFDMPVWLDAQKRIYDLTEVHDAAILLVRPDGYVGYVAQPADEAKLAAYLDGFLLRIP